MKYVGWDHNRELKHLERDIQNRRAEKEITSVHSSDENTREYERKLLLIVVGAAIILLVALILMVGSGAWFLIQLALPK